MSDYMMLVYWSITQKLWQADVQDEEGNTVFTATSPVIGEVVAAGQVSLLDWSYREPDHSVIHSLCDTCNGSGEGMHPGTVCPACKGHGETTHGR